MIVKENFSLKTYNTFGIDMPAKHFVQVESRAELVEFLQQSPLRKTLKLVLGGGSNMLLTKPIDGTVLHINLHGKKIINQTENTVLVEAAAGENWHNMVLWAIENNWGGIENMSLIPGNIGTAPIQNIGAYGVELKDTFHSLDAIEIATGNQVSFTKTECQFGYRDSIFKNVAKGKYIIVAVRLMLHKAPHTLSTQYGAIQNELAASGIKHPTIKNVSDAVISIRESKLPNPAEIGNSGSFFKNPIVEKNVADQLLKEHPSLPVYPIENGQVKVAAGWLIEHAGLKGFRDGDAGVHKKQALVLVNYGSATGEEVFALAQKVISTVQEKFGIKLEAEVNLI